MNDRVFSVIGFGKQSEKIAIQLESEGVGYGWGVDTRLLLILIDSNSTDEFVIRLCRKAKDKKSRIFFLCLNPRLSFNNFHEMADGILINDNKQQVLSIIRTLKRVIYNHNLFCLDMIDVMFFLRTKQTEIIRIKEYHFPKLSISKAGKITYPHSQKMNYRHLTSISLCKEPNKKIGDKIISQIGDYYNSLVYDSGADISTYSIISVSNRNDICCFYS